MLEILQKKFDKYRDTCSITKLRNGCVTFIRNEKYLHYLKDVIKDIWVITPTNLQSKIKNYQQPYCPNIKFYYTDHPEFEFTIYHNEIHKNNKHIIPQINNNCKIHSTVIMDVDGLKIVNSPNGKKIQFIHTGYVEIGSDVEIGPYTVIHRGTMDKTVIQSGCKIGAKNKIGHNCNIGYDTIIASGAILNGGIIVGHNCWISSGVLIKHYTTIKENTVIGMGSVVTKDVADYDIVAGNPAKKIGSRLDKTFPSEGMGAG